MWVSVVAVIVWWLDEYVCVCVCVGGGGVEMCIIYFAIKREKWVFVCPTSFSVDFMNVTNYCRTWAYDFCLI